MPKLLIGAAVVAAFILLIAGGQVKAQTAPVCNGIDSIGKYYAPDDVAAYQFSGADAKAIIAILASTHGAPPGAPAASVFIGIDLYDNTTDFFLFDTKGRGTAHLGPLPMDTTLMIMDQAKIAAPFGETWHQEPGFGA